MQNLRARLAQMPNVRTALANAGWLFADRIFRMGVGLLVGVWVARYLGPERFGLLNYLGAIVGMCSAVASGGLNGIVVRDLVRDPREGQRTLGSAGPIQTVGGALACAISVVWIRLARPGDGLAMALGLLLSIGMLVRGTDVVRYWFESQVRIRYVVWVENGVAVLASLARVGLILAGAGLVAFGWVILGEGLLVAAGLVIACAWKGLPLHAWRADRGRLLGLLRDAWPMVFSNLAVMLYMRIDQVMLDQMLGDRSVGLYSAAVKLSELWYFIPVAITSSMFPLILKSEGLAPAIYQQRLQMLFNLLAMLSIGIAVAVTLCAEPFVRLLYGSAFAAAVPVLDIHVWGLLFVAWGLAGNNWYLSKNLQALTLVRTLAGAVINILVNLLLIPRHGMVGAAIGTLLAQMMVAWLLDAVDTRTRHLFWLKTRSLAYPLLLIQGKGRMT